MKNVFSNGTVARYWWVPLITGLLAIAIGVWCLCSPDTSLPVLALVFAACICAAGILNISYGVANNAPHSSWGWSLALGLFEIIVGVWLFLLPEAQLITVFIYTVGIYIVFVAINAICEACMLSSCSNAWLGWMISFLLITLVFGIIFLAGPIAGGIAVWLYIGISFIAFGFYRLILAAKIKKLNNMINR